MKYALIQEHDAMFSVSRMCRVFEVSRSWFYEWLSRPESARKQADRQLTADIKQAFEDSRQTYGTRRIRDDLDQQGQRVSRARIGRLMRQAGLRCKTRRRFRATTNSNHTLMGAHLGDQLIGHMARDSTEIEAREKPAKRVKSAGVEADETPQRRGRPKTR